MFRSGGPPLARRPWFQASVAGCMASRLGQLGNGVLGDVDARLGARERSLVFVRKCLVWSKRLYGEAGKGALRVVPTRLLHTAEVRVRIGSGTCLDVGRVARKWL